MGHTVEFFCNAGTQSRMLLAEGGRQVAPVFQVVQPDRPPDELGQFPLVTVPDVRMHKRKVAQKP